MLPEIFVDDDRHAVGEVERARVCAHRYAHAIVVIGVQDVLGQSLCLSAEKDVAISLVIHLAMGVSGLGRRVQKLRARVCLRHFEVGRDVACVRRLVAEVCGEEGVHVGISAHVRDLPIVETAAFEIFVFPAESARLDDVQDRAGRRAGADDVAGVVGDLGVDQDDVDHASASRSSAIEKSRRLRLSSLPSNSAISVAPPGVVAAPVIARRRGR